MTWTDSKFCIVAIGFEPGPEIRALWIPMMPSPTVLPLLMMARWIESELRREAIVFEWVSPVGWFLDGYIAAAVEDRNAGLRVLRSVARAAKLESMAEIAWLCEAEGIWRVAHPAAPAQPFERFVSEERFARYGDSARNMHEHAKKIRRQQEGGA